MLGKFIGQGWTRLVFEYELDPNWVVKVLNPRNWQDGFDIENYNFKELKIYEIYKNYGFEHLLAPCKVENNLFLMRKADPLPAGKYTINLYRYAHKEPYNWGLIDGKPVRIDYSDDLILEDNKAYLPVTKEEIRTSMYYLRKFASPYKDKIKVELNKQTMAMAYEQLVSTIEIK